MLVSRTLSIATPRYSNHESGPGDTFEFVVIRRLVNIYKGYKVTRTRMAVTKAVIV